MCVGDGHDEVFCAFLSHLLFELGFEQTEGNGRFCSGARFRDDDDSKSFSAEIFLKLKKIILADVLTGKDNARSARLGFGERIAQSFDHSFRAEIAATDADGDYDITLIAQIGSRRVDFVNERGGSACRQINPAEKIVAGARGIMDF